MLQNAEEMRRERPGSGQRHKRGGKKLRKNEKRAALRGDEIAREGQRRAAGRRGGGGKGGGVE